MPQRQHQQSRETFWRQHLERQRVSGCSIRAYCAQHRLHEASFYSWRRALAAQDRQAASTPQPATPPFVPVTLLATPASASDSPIDIRLTNGRRIRVRPGCDRELLATVLALLEDQPC